MLTTPETSTEVAASFGQLFLARARKDSENAATHSRPLAAPHLCCGHDLLTHVLVLNPHL